MKKDSKWVRLGVYGAVVIMVVMAIWYLYKAYIKHSVCYGSR